MIEFEVKRAKLKASDAYKIYEDTQEYIFTLIQQAAKAKKTKITIYEKFQGDFRNKILNNYEYIRCYVINEKKDCFDNFQATLNEPHGNELINVNINDLIELGYNITLVHNNSIVISWDKV